ncbi:MAG: hypothetical protein AAF364_04090 [Pseudomonadota bacterium]
MRLPTKQLITKIEHLSSELSPKQLAHFLDIIDAMTALVEEAGTVGLDTPKYDNPPIAPSSSAVH